MADQDPFLADLSFYGLVKESSRKIIISHHKTNILCIEVIYKQIRVIQVLSTPEFYSDCVFTVESSEFRKSSPKAGVRHVTCIPAHNNKH